MREKGDERKMKTFVLSTLSEEDVIRLEKDCNLAVRLQPDAGRIDPRALMDGDQAAYLLRDLTDRLRFPSRTSPLPCSSNNTVTAC